MPEKITDKEKEAAEPGTDMETNKSAPAELPTEVKAKLRRLDKLESRYHGMRGTDCFQMNLE
jgi:hypothetical protein